MDRVISALDEPPPPPPPPPTIYMDLSKAFDTLDHNIPLAKLRYYEIKKRQWGGSKVTWQTDSKM